MREVLSLDQLLSMDPNDAAVLLSARLLDPSSEHDALILDEWLQADDQNLNAWLEIQLCLAALDEADQDEPSNWQDLREEALDLRPNKSIRWPRWAAAAAVGGLAIAGLTLQTGTFPWTRENQSSSSVIATAEHGKIEYKASTETRTVSLADGSAVTLDAGSVVYVNYTTDRRRLELVKGRAHFSVHRDASRPFAVAAAGSTVTALGTQFDVSIRPTELSVVLFEGRVVVDIGAAPTKRVELQPGNRLLVQANGASTVSPIEADGEDGWRNGFAAFHDTPLTEVVDELNKYTTEKLVIREPSLSRLRISGNFRTGDLGRFSRTISQVYPVRIVRRSDGQWEITASEKSKKIM